MKLDRYIPMKLRIPRKLKKRLKSDPYFCIFGAMWIRQMHFDYFGKQLTKYYGVIPPETAR